MSEKLSMYIFEENGTIFRVYDFYECLENKETFYRNNAYIVRDSLRDMVLPFRGDMKNFAALFHKDTIPGIYRQPKTGKFQIRGPRTKKERELYASSNVVNLLNPKDLNKYSANMFRDMQLEHKASGDIFTPPISDDDDFTSKAMKTFITAKQISFGDYGARLENLSATKGDGSMGNARNNAKRALTTNHSMSASKMVYYATAFDADIALVLKDKPDCPNPALRPGEQLVVYPVSSPFKIENLITLNDLTTRIQDKTYHRPMDDDEVDFDEIGD